MVRNEICCCPKTTIANTTCLAEVHAMEKTFKSYSLLSNMTIGGKRYPVEPFCAEIRHKVLVPITCYERKLRILIGNCKEDQHQTLRIIGKRAVGCKCQNYEVRRLRIRCGE